MQYRQRGTVVWGLVTMLALAMSYLVPLHWLAGVGLFVAAGPASELLTRWLIGPPPPPAES